MKYTKNMIIRRFNAGEKIKIVAFWGHTPNPGKMTKTCFSQWYACKFEVDGVMYHTAEQYMMAQKAILMGDTATCREIMAAFNPREYKKLGRKVRNFDPVLWDREKYNVVLRGKIWQNSLRIPGCLSSWTAPETVCWSKEAHTMQSGV